MRRLTLLLVLLPAACGGGETEMYSVVEGFLDRARPAECVAASVGEATALTEVRAVTDSTWLLLDEPQRRVTEFDHRLRPLWSLEYAAAGPGSAARAVSAALLGDSAVALADRGALRIVVVTREGRPLWSVPLGFMPNVIAAAPDGEVLVTPLRVGDDPPTLLARVGPDGREEIPVRARHYDNMMISAMGNAALVEALPDGRAFVVHEYLRPRGFAVAGNGRVTQLSVPTPDGAVRFLDFVPAPPFTEADAGMLHVPALGLGLDRRASEVWVMTRSGKFIGDVGQRAILRMTDDFEFLEGWTADIRAADAAILPGPGVAILATDDDRLYSCTLPRGGAVADAP